jgi:hypothetical protein
MFQRFGVHCVIHFQGECEEGVDIPSLTPTAILMYRSISSFLLALTMNMTTVHAETLGQLQQMTWLDHENPF